MLLPSSCLLPQWPAGRAVPSPPATSLRRRRGGSVYRSAPALTYTFPLPAEGSASRWPVLCRYTVENGRLGPLRWALGARAIPAVAIGGRGGLAYRDARGGAGGASGLAVAIGIGVIVG